MGAPDVGVHYVAQSGSDANSGLDWVSAYRTVAAAVKALPQNTNGEYAGTVRVGDGEFLEDDLPIPSNSHLRIVGNGATSGGPAGGRGTIIGRNAEPDLFRATSDWTHGFSLENLTLAGRKSVVSESADLCVLTRGGYNCHLLNVRMMDSSRHGLRLGDAVNFVARTFGVLRSDAAAVKIECADQLSIISFQDVQMDNNNGPGFLVEVTGGVTDPQTGPMFTRMLSIRDAKFEARRPGHPQGAPPNAHPQAICVEPSGVVPLLIRVESLWANFTNPVDPQPDTGLLYETDGPGEPTMWTVDNVGLGRGYEYLFRSELTGVEHVARVMRRGEF